MNGGGAINWKALLHEALFGSSIYLLVGALIVGYITGDSGWKAEKVFADDLFKGILTFFFWIWVFQLLVDLKNSLTLDCS